MSPWVYENKDQQYFFLLQNAHVFPPWAENKMSMKLAILKHFRLPAATFSLDRPWVYTGTDWREISQSYHHPASDERRFLETSIPQIPGLCGAPQCPFPMKERGWWNWRWPENGSLVMTDSVGTQSPVSHSIPLECFTESRERAITSPFSEIPDSLLYQFRFASFKIPETKYIRLL